jgi:hypothetical protein
MGLVSIAGKAVYSATKHGLVGLTKASCFHCFTLHAPLIMIYDVSVSFTCECQHCEVSYEDSVANENTSYLDESHRSSMQQLSFIEKYILPLFSPAIGGINRGETPNSVCHAHG